MSRLLLLAGACLLAVACKQPGDDQVSPDDAAVAEATIEITETLSGATAYKKACATCHEQGLGNAPKTGDRDAWAGRSWLWEAILVEHARQGYLGMPAQGEGAQLSDAEISLAAEYMLRQVHPEVPRD
jgi:cytochrome c5